MIRTSRAFTFEVSMKSFLLILLMWVPILLSAQPGRSAFSFTQVPVSPIQAALGGTQVAAFRGDIAQTTVNPAFMDSTLHGSLSLSYLNYLTTINQASLAYGHQFDSLGFGSAYLRYFDYGTFQEIDETGIELGQFKAVDYELGVSFARPYKYGISYGATFKQVFSNMYNYFAYGAAIDLGAFYRSKDGNLTLGLTADDIGVKLVDYTSDGHELFPWSINVAIAKKFDKAPLLFALQYSDLQKWDLAAADQDALDDVNMDPLTGERERSVLTFDNFARHLNGSVVFMPSDKFNLMIGYNFRRRLELAIAERPAMVGFSFGAMVKVKRFGIQYTLSSYHLGGTSNHFAITTNLNEWYTKRTAS